MAHRIHGFSLSLQRGICQCCGLAAWSLDTCPLQVPALWGCAFPSREPAVCVSPSPLPVSSCSDVCTPCMSFSRALNSCIPKGNRCQSTPPWVVGRAPHFSGAPLRTQSCPGFQGMTGMTLGSMVLTSERASPVRPALGCLAPVDIRILTAGSGNRAVLQASLGCK